MGWPATQEQIEASDAVRPRRVWSATSAAAAHTAETIERIEAFVAAGCTEPVLTPLGNYQNTVEKIARGGPARWLSRIQAESEFVEP